MRSVFSSPRSLLQLRRSHHSSHEVFNQAKPFQNVNVLRSDPALVSSLELSEQKGSKIDWRHLDEYSVLTGSAKLMEAADLAEKNRPVLRQFDNYGRRIDCAEYHHTYHDLMSHGIQHGVCGIGFKNAQPGSQMMRAALIYMQNQLEAGHCCPLVMTAAGIPVLQRVTQASPWLKTFVDKIFTFQYDPSNAPIEQKKGVTLGMSMTEKQGGSDVRANTTLATPLEQGKAGIGAAYSLVGHKWFTSAPMCDAFLTLAKTPGVDTPSCFLVPRWKPSGERNHGFLVMRLKDKLADRANASSEVEYHDAWGMMIGEEGKGVKTIIEMVQATRLDCTLGSAGGARRALQVALNHTSTRQAFGRVLMQQPLMQNVLTDLAIESEASTWMAMRMAMAYDASYAGSDSHSQALVQCATPEEAQELFRIGVTVSKYQVTKRLPQFTYECMEQMGGNGFVEDFPMAKLFRHSPLNAIWEGSGNVIALDLLRGFKSMPLLLREIHQAKGMDSHVDGFVAQLEKTLRGMMSGDKVNLLSDHNQRMARNVTDRLAMALQASILLRMGDSVTAKAYIASRIHRGGDSAGCNYGGSFVFDAATCEHILARNLPKFSA